MILPRLDESRQFLLKLAGFSLNALTIGGALWELFWYNYSQSRYQTCEKLAKNHLANYSKKLWMLNETIK